MVAVEVCVGNSCHMKGSKRITDRLRQLAAEYGLSDEIKINGVLCMDECMNGACVRLEGRVFKLSPETADEFFMSEILPRAGKSGPSGAPE